MKIIVLVEKSPSSVNFKKRNGICLYIESNGHKMLFDLSSNGNFISSMNALSLDISKVDTVVLSSGYAENSGGLKEFLHENTTANVYINAEAFRPYYTTVLGMKVGCGISKDFKTNPQVRLTSNLYFIDDYIQIYTNPEESSHHIHGLQKFYVKQEDEYVKDPLYHEQYLLIEEEGKLFLFIGSGNKGVHSIIRKAEAICNREIDYVFAGFSRLECAVKRRENDAFVHDELTKLGKKKTRFYVPVTLPKDIRDMLEEHLGKALYYTCNEDEIVL